MKNRCLLLPTVLVGLCFVQADHARAAASCAELSEQLAALPEVIGTSVQARALSNAMTQQTLEMQKAQRLARDRNCPTASIATFGTLHDPVCDEITDSIARMDANQKQLSAQYENASRAASLTARRARLRTALEANECRGDEVASAEVDQEQDEQLRPSTDFFAPDRTTGARHGGSAMEGSDPTARPGPLRTVCVRTCDGAFFPISSNATPLNFERDAQLCHQMCPGSQAELFYHPLMSPRNDDMVSAETGIPYTDLPNAYAYRDAERSSTPACGCDFSAYYEENMPAGSSLASDKPSYSAITDIATVPKKKAETRIDPREREYDPVKDTARQVGPAFVPSETTSIDLAHPAGEATQLRQ